MKKESVERKVISPKKAAEIYGLSIGTLANYRYQKHGPRYFKCGRKVLYVVEHLEEWILRNPVLTMDSLSEEQKGGL
jgi:hypothetical protein